MQLTRHTLHHSSCPGRCDAQQDAAGCSSDAQVPAGKECMLAAAQQPVIVRLEPSTELVVTHLFSYDKAVKDKAAVEHCLGSLATADHRYEAARERLIASRSAAQQAEEEARQAQEEFRTNQNAASSR